MPVALGISLGGGPVPGVYSHPIGSGFPDDPRGDADCAWWLGRLPYHPTTPFNSSDAQPRMNAIPAHELRAETEEHRERVIPWLTKVGIIHRGFDVQYTESQLVACLVLVPLWWISQRVGKSSLLFSIGWPSRLPYLHLHDRPA